MKSILKKIISSILCVLVVLSSVSVAVVAAYTTDYPEGVSAEEAFNAVNSTDKLLSNAVPAFTGKTLSGTVTPMLYNSETLSSVTVAVYKELSSGETDISSAGIDASVSAVAEALSAYPKVKEALLKADSWENVDLTGVDWGVTDKNGFATAFGRIFTPFNDMLYMLLCSGTFTVAGFISIQGADGYANSIVPMLKALKCTDIMSQADFTAAAQQDKCNMVKNIVLMVLSFLEEALKAPADTLTDSLPSFAYFIESGEMDACMASLMAPITDNTLVKLAGLLNLFDTSALEFDIDSMLSSGIGGLTGDSAFKMAELDMASLSKCGSHNGTGFVSDKGRAYVEIMRWLVDTLKLNEGDLSSLAGNDSSFISADMMKSIVSADTDALVGALIHLFTPSEIGEAKAYVYPAVTATTVQYTPNLTKENYEKVLNEIDDLLDEFVKEGGSYNSIEAMLKGRVYTNSNINSLVTSVYGALEEQGMTEMLTLLGVDASPKGVASALKSRGYTTAASALQKSESWSKVSLKNVTWGFSNGSRKGFRNALTAVLSPLLPILRVLLAEKDIVIMDSITIKGADGYNTAVIPVLEALGCDASSVKTYSQYIKNADSDRLLTDILDPVFDLLDEVFDKPVKTLTRVLPNIVYFMNSGSLEACISNLMLPITALTDKFSGIIDMNTDFSSLTGELDISSLMSGMLEGSGMKMAELDINSLAGVGTKTEKTSKRTVNGAYAKYSYIESDQTGVLMVFLRFLAKTLKMPGNENLLMGSMGSNDAFSAYSSSISEQFSKMTEDELIEWLYNLLFKERAQIEIVIDEDYVPTIIYTEKEKNYTPLYITIGALGAAALIGAVLYFNRKRLYY